MAEGTCEVILAVAGPRVRNYAVADCQSVP